MGVLVLGLNSKWDTLIRRVLIRYWGHNMTNSEIS